MEIKSVRNLPTEHASTDEVRDMFEAPARWPEPKREVPRRERTSPYLTVDEETVQPPVSAPARRTSPYVESPGPTPGAPAALTRPTTTKKTSPYAEEVRTDLAPAVHAGFGRVLIDLKPSRLSLGDRLELARLKSSKAVHRIVWLPEDAVVTLQPGAEFGEARALPWGQAGLETLGFAQENLRRSLRRLPLGKIGRTLGLYATIVAGVFVLFNFTAIQSQLSYRINPPTINPALVTASAQGAQPAPAPTGEFRLLIPKLGKDVPVVLSQSRQDKAMQAELLNGVVHYSGTALPGEPGNIGITGHSSNYFWVKSAYNDVFANLGALEGGDVAVIYYGGRTYRYQVTGKTVVDASQAEVLNPTPNKTLTLITCWPVGTSAKRLVVTLNQTDPVQANTPKVSADHLPEI